LVAHIPRPVATALGRQLGSLYSTLNPRRRKIVAANLSPVLGNEPETLTRRASDTFREFGVKLADLLLFESGASVDAWVEPGNGWQNFDAARASGKGVLLVTVHLGNWELGSVLLRRLGLSPLVLTAPEPTAELTQSRLAARKRLGIETLVEKIRFSSSKSSNVFRTAVSWQFLSIDLPLKLRCRLGFWAAPREQISPLLNSHAPPVASSFLFTWCGMA
jgi:lauroyl/myristoyl acyltransferase